MQGSWQIFVLFCVVVLAIWYCYSERKKLDLLNPFKSSPVGPTITSFKTNFKFAYDSGPKIIKQTGVDCNMDTHLTTCDPNKPFSCSKCDGEAWQCIVPPRGSRVINTSNNKSKIIPEGQGVCTNVTLDSRCTPGRGFLVYATTTDPKAEPIVTCMCNNFWRKSTLDSDCENLDICGAGGTKLDPKNTKNNNVSEYECNCPQGQFSMLNKDLDYPVHNCIEYTLGNYTEELPTNDIDTLGKIKKTTKIVTMPKSALNLAIQKAYKPKNVSSVASTCYLTGQPITDAQVLQTNTRFKKEFGPFTLFENKPSGYYVSAKNNKVLAIRRNPRDYALYNKEEGIISRSNDRVLNGLWGPDAVIKLQWDSVDLLGYFTNDIFMDIILYFTYNDYNKPVIDLIMGKPYKTGTQFSMDLTGHDLHFPGNFYESYEFKTAPLNNCEQNPVTIGTGHEGPCDLFDIGCHARKLGNAALKVTGNFRYKCTVPIYPNPLNQEEMNLFREGSLTKNYDTPDSHNPNIWKAVQFSVENGKFKMPGRYSQFYINGLEAMKMTNAKFIPLPGNSTTKWETNERLNPLFGLDECPLTGKARLLFNQKIYSPEWTTNEKLRFMKATFINGEDRIHFIRSQMAQDDGHTGVTIRAKLVNNVLEFRQKITNDEQAQAIKLLGIEIK